MKYKLTQEDKLAQQLLKSVDNLSVDLDQVGIVIAQIAPSVLFNRLEVILESAREEKERLYVRSQRDTLW